MEQKTNGLGVAGFLLALINLFLLWIPGIGAILCFLSLLFSFLGLFKAPRGFAIAGFVLSIVALIVEIVLYGIAALAFLA